MEFALNRRGGVPVKDQLRFQLELKILSGEIAAGQRLPSVRALARRLKLHANTVSAAYQDLQATGHVDLMRGSGVFVKGDGPSAPQNARGLDEMIRLALYLAFRQGFSGAEIRAAVERWLAAAPPDRVVVVDPSAEMAELIVHEIRGTLGITVDHCSIDDAAREPARLSGALAVTLPYHVERLREISPSTAVEVVTLSVSLEDRKAIMGLAPGSIVLVVSHSPTVLPFATVFLKSLRGDEIHVETRLLSAQREWRRLASAADLAFADALSVDAVRRAKPKRLREVRIVTPTAVTRLRDALTVVVPRETPAGRR